RGATGEHMRGIMRTMGGVLIGTAAAAVFVTTTYGQSGQSILGKPSPANHYIETPAGWIHPKTAWGEPDIQAMLNMMQAAGIPLERCGGNRKCDKNKAWLPEEAYQQGRAAARGRVDQARQLTE